LAGETGLTVEISAENLSSGEEYTFVATTETDRTAQAVLSYEGEQVEEEGGEEEEEEEEEEDKFVLLES